MSSADPVAWTLFVADQVGTRLAQIDVFHRFALIARHNAVSTWELELPTNTLAADVLLKTQRPRIVVRTDDVTFRSGPVTYWDRQLDAEGDVLSLVGADDLLWLKRRLAHPAPAAAAPPYSTAYDSRSGNAAQVLAQYIDVNAGPSATSARRVPGLTVPVPAPAGGNVALQARYENLLDFVVRTADTVGLGVRVTDLVLGIAPPVTRPVTFSIELSTMAETTAVAEAPDANYVYVAGQGEGSARTIVEVSDSPSFTDWGRAETFIDRRDTNDTSKLTQAGREELGDSVVPRLVTFTPLQSDAQQFPRDWSVGDIVTVQVGTTTRVDVVREVQVELEGGAPTAITARIGFAGRLAIFRAAVNADRRIRQLERV